MSQTKIDVGMISATGTASSSTVLKGDGTWGSGSPLEFVSSSTASDSASVALTGIDNTADTWMVLAEGVNVATDAQQIRMRTSNDTSSHSYDSGSSDYGWGVIATYGYSDTFYDEYDQYDSEIQFGLDPIYPGNDATSGWAAKIFLHNAGSTTYHTMATFDITMQGTSQQAIRAIGSGVRYAAEAVTAVQFTMQSGNIDSGKFSLFKIKHA